MIWKHTAACLLLTAVVVSLYAPVLTFKPVFDDPYYLAIGSDPLAFHSRPLSQLSFRIGGGDPSTAHSVNVGLHALAALVLYAFLFDLFRWHALLGAMLFAVHPLFGEGAQYITARASVMAALFTWMALYVDLKLAGRWKYALISAFSIAAITSKHEGLLVIPLLVLFRLIRNGERLKIAALLFLGLAVSPMLRWANPFNVRVGPEGKIALLGVIPVLTDCQHVVSAIRSYVEHILPMMLFPISLTALPPMLPEIGFGFMVSLAAIAAAACVMVFARPALSYAAASLLFSPPLFKAIIPQGDAQFEYRAYMTGLGFALTACFVFSKLTKKTAMIGVAALALTLALQTHSRHEVWGNGIALWSDVIEKDPSARAIVNLGIEYQNEGNARLAILEYENSLMIQPNAVAHMNLGGIYTALGQLSKSQEHLEKAVAMAPQLSDVWVNYAALLVKMRQPGHALVMAQRAEDLEPNSWSARQNKAMALLALNRVEDARREMQTAEELQRNLKEF